MRSGRRPSPARSDSFCSSVMSSVKRTSTTWRITRPPYPNRSTSLPSASFRTMAPAGQFRATRNSRSSGSAATPSFTTAMSSSSKSKASGESATQFPELMQAPRSMLTEYPIGRPLVSSSGPAYHRLERFHHSGPDLAAQPAQDVVLEVPELRGPHRGVDLHQQDAVVEPAGPDVGGHRLAHRRRPGGHHGGDVVGVVQVELRRHLGQRLPHPPHRPAAGGHPAPLLELPALLRRHGRGLPSSRPPATHTTRSAGSPGGRAPAVVTSAWAIGRWPTRLDARVSSSSEKTSSSRRTGGSPTTSVTTTCPARRTARASDRCSPWEANRRASSPSIDSRQSSRWGPTSVSRRSRSAERERATASASNGATSSRRVSSRRVSSASASASPAQAASYAPATSAGAPATSP